METKQENENYEEILDDYYNYLKEENDKLQNAFEYYKKNSLIPFDKIENFDEYDELFDFENGDYFHIGYCTVEKSNYKNGFRPNAEYFKIKECEFENKDLAHYSAQFYYFLKVYHGERKFHTLVWQTTTCCEDDYSGYILFPIKDGRYWIVSFANI